MNSWPDLPTISARAFATEDESVKFIAELVPSYELQDLQCCAFLAADQNLHCCTFPLADQNLQFCTFLGADWQAADRVQANLHPHLELL